MRATVGFTTPGPADVEFEIVDITGRVFQTTTHSVGGAGRHTMDIDLSNFPSGAYLCTLKSGDVTLSRPLVVVG